MLYHQAFIVTSGKTGENAKLKKPRKWGYRRMNVQEAGKGDDMVIWVAVPRDISDIQGLEAEKFARRKTKPKE